MGSVANWRHLLDSNAAKGLFVSALCELVIASGFPHYIDEFVRNWFVAHVVDAIFVSAYSALRQLRLMQLADRLAASCC
jgi:hypothetical protein